MTNTVAVIQVKLGFPLGVLSLNKITQEWSLTGAQEQFHLSLKIKNPRESSSSGLEEDNEGEQEKGHV